MALRTLEQIVTAAQLADPSAKEVDVLYTCLHNVLTCQDCGGMGVERPMEVKIDAHTGEEIVVPPAPTAGQLLGTDKTATGLATGASLASFAVTMARTGNPQAAIDASGLALCTCRLEALEFVHAIGQANAASIIMPQTRRTR